MFFNKKKQKNKIKSLRYFPLNPLRKQYKTVKNR